MARRMVYDIDVDVPAADLYRHFTGRQYWEDLVASYLENSTRTEIAHFATGESGTDVSFAHIIAAEDLPAIARPVVPARFAVTREQHFDPFEQTANQASGRYRALVPVAPVDVSGDYILTDTETGSRMRLETRCKVRVPIIGGQIEQLIVNGLQSLFAEEGRFTREWLARRA